MHCDAENARVNSKAMRLTEIFDFRQFPIAESQKFSTVENRPKLSRLYFDFNFCENLTQTTEIIENFDICQKFRYIIDIFDIRRYL